MPGVGTRTDCVNPRVAYKLDNARKVSMVLIVHLPKKGARRPKRKTKTEIQYIKN